MYSWKEAGRQFRFRYTGMNLEHASVPRLKDENAAELFLQGVALSPTLPAQYSWR
jgi:hypothetical protein